MKKGTILEGTVSKIQFPNKGIVEIDGEKAVVKNAASRPENPVCGKQEPEG